MVRWQTAVCAFLAGFAGYYLHAERKRDIIIEKEISDVLIKTLDARQRTGILRLRWAFDNQPDRLRVRAANLPGLRPIKPSQYVRLEQLGSRLPPPRAAPPSDDSDDAITTH